MAQRNGSRQHSQLVFLDAPTVYLCLEKPTMRNVVLLAATVVISIGCSLPREKIWVERKVYHALPGPHALHGQSFHVTFPDKEQADSLEMKTHGMFLARRLEDLGMRPAPSSEVADLVFSLKFEVTTRQKLIMFGGSRTVTSGGMTTFSSQTTYQRGGSTTMGSLNVPTATLSETGASGTTETEYVRVATLLVHSRKSSAKGSNTPEYEGTAYSEGFTRDTPRIFPSLLGALLHRFPSRSGEYDGLLIHLDDFTADDSAPATFLR